MSNKMTVLDMVQDILSDMNSDEVNSIADTVESLQVATIVRSTYYEMISRRNWPHLKKMTTFTASGDSDKPTHMLVGESIKEVLRVEYNCLDLSDTDTMNYIEMKYQTVDDFLVRCNGLNTSNDDVTTITDYSGIKFQIRTDKNPTYYTSFDDDNIVFDSYLDTVDTTLQESKNRVHVVTSPTFTLEDAHTPDLPEEVFSGLLAEAKSVCFSRIKQAPDGKAEQQARRQRHWASRKAFKVDGGIKLPDYSKRR